MLAVRKLATRSAILVGALPPPITGQSVLFRLLVDGIQSRKLLCTPINISGRDAKRPAGAFSVRRVVEISIALLHFAAQALRPQASVYLTIAQSWIGFLRDFCFIWLAWALRHRIVLHLHGGGYGRFYNGLTGLRRWIVKKTWQRASVIIVLGDSLRAMLDFDADLLSKVTVVPNTAPDEDAHRPRQGKHLCTDRPKLLFLSNLLRSKGYLVLLEAIRLLVGRGYPVQGHFCGYFIPDSGTADTSASMEKEFKSLVREWGLSDHVHYHGVVWGEGKKRLLECSDFLILPTSYAPEGQPVAIMEALAHGLVVVSTAIAGIPELLGNNRAGVIADPEPNAIAKQVESLILRKEWYHKLSCAALDSYWQRYSQAIHLEALIPCILASPVPPFLARGDRVAQNRMC
jgi:glycosyltransferase involved in cell wall biosynthesis